MSKKAKDGKTTFYATLGKNKSGRAQHWNDWDQRYDHLSYLKLEDGSLSVWIDRHDRSASFVLNPEQAATLAEYLNKGD